MIVMIDCCYCNLVVATPTKYERDLDTTRHVQRNMRMVYPSLVNLFYEMKRIVSQKIC